MSTPIKRKAKDAGLDSGLTYHDPDDFVEPSKRYIIRINELNQMIEDLRQSNHSKPEPPTKKKKKTKQTIDIDFTDDSKFNDDEKSDEEMICDMLQSCHTMDEVCPHDFIERFYNLRRAIVIMYREFAYHDRKFFEMTDKEQQEFIEAKMCYH